MSLPFFPLFPDDFEADTAHLTMAEDGAYNRLLRLCWRSPQCMVPADEAWLMRKMRARTEEEKAAVRAVVDEFFDTDQSMIFNRRLKKEWFDAAASYERRAKAGSKGGHAKALKTKKTGSSNAKAMLKQPEPEPEPISMSPDGDIGISPLCDVSEAVAEYNAVASRAGWPQVQKMTDVRRRAARARLGECGGMAGWRTVLEKAEASDFLCGRSSKSWTGFGFDWLTAPRNFVKIMEGNYDNRQPSGGFRAAADDPTLRAIARAAGAF